MTNAPVSAGPEESLHEALVASARRLAPRIRELAPAIDQEAKLPRDLVDAFLDAGFFHMLLPRDFGGLEASPVTQARVVEEVARADGSAGWCLMIAAQSCSFAGLLAPDEAGKIWGPRDIVAGTARPIGRALRVVSPAPGYRVSGRWPFASGSSHATWFMGEAMVYDDGDKPVLDAAASTCHAPCSSSARTSASMTPGTRWDSAALPATTSASTACSCRRAAAFR